MQSITNHLTIASTWVQSVLQAQCRNWLLAMWHAACAVLSFQAFQRCCATEEQKERGSINSRSSVYTADPKFLEAWKTCNSRQTELYSFRLLRFHVKKSDFAMWMATRSVLRHFEHQGCCPAGQLYLWVGRCWQVHLEAAFLYFFVLVTKTDSSLDNSYGTPLSRSSELRQPSSEHFAWDLYWVLAWRCCFTAMLLIRTRNAVKHVQTSLYIQILQQAWHVTEHLRVLIPDTIAVALSQVVLNGKITMSINDCQRIAILATWLDSHLFTCLSVHGNEGPAPLWLLHDRTFALFTSVAWWYTVTKLNNAVCPTVVIAREEVLSQTIW